MAALLAGGHVLFEDIPGVGKTMLVKSLAKAIQSDYKRVQFTPDLLPNDVLGVSILIPKATSSSFVLARSSPPSSWQMRSTEPHQGRKPHS